ncbi:hypothetical protein BZG36_00634 [Bifiguratus adelaidae]|uniref:DNA-directed RNA polymerase subunit n=1 Tax=Bifiguratus adelaidae TaxID=1938954 RepID=A0A261Y7D0_9FUNG|nr:hypothetical protein BZG36_00634 [Bifiguratus adelaidae]
MVKVAEFECNQCDLYTVPDRSPVKHGVLDLRLGTSTKDGTCETCFQKTAECAGHYGYIKLVLPVFHIGYFRAIINILQDICKAVNDQCKKQVYCPYCGALNGFVKKVAALKIVHEKWRAKKAASDRQEFLRTFDAAAQAIPDIKPHLSKAQDDLNPLKVLKLFQNITPEDCELLGLDPVHGRPELYIWQYLPVPPACVRPSVVQDGASTEDDLTAKLTEIIFTNAMIRTAIEKGKTHVSSLMEQWDLLQLTSAMYINSELPGVPNANVGKPSRGLCQRLKGKQGRFRGNLSGKRVDFSGRTVISPDPNMRIDQVAVPELVAKILTYPERVFSHNIDRLKRAIINGPNVHPGANYLVSGQTGFKRFLKFGNRKEIADDLKIGDVVERHLIDGDVVLFNRQPSLHRLSIMAHYAKIKPWRTFRFNECVCAPYNADFDGDEMNMHVPQTEEARTEALELMGVKNNLCTPRNGQPLIAATQDFITASFLISKKDRFYTRAQFVQVCSMMGDAELQIDIPPPAVIKPRLLWTGKQVFNVLMKPNKHSPVNVNLETRTKSFTKRAGEAPDMCPADGWLIIRNSEVMCGLMDKSIVGDGNKNSIFYVIMRDYGPEEAATCMNRLAKLCARWLANEGFSIGINDVTPGDRLTAIKNRRIAEAYAKCDEYIAQFNKGQLECMAGCDEEQTLESKVSGVLSDVRSELGNICMTDLSRHNAPLIMATCGSKGSWINVSQMVACVGQQIISGSRIPDGFQDRSLPHFLKHSKSPPAKGFVRNSFFTGLTSTEFLFHAVSGREGLVDTAVKTAETGYMQRRLMKALEDLTTHYDLSVRGAAGNMVQFCYGDDGLDPLNLEGSGQPVEFERNFKHARMSVPRDKDRPLMPWEVINTAEQYVASAVWKRNCNDEYTEQVLKHVKNNIVQHLARVRRTFGLSEGTAKPSEEYMDIDLDAFVDKEQVTTAQNVYSVTEPQIRRYLDLCLAKYMKAKIEPGTAVGAVGAQSIGEPGTQMTLKTFHFAGVASMNITLGVPRIKEIINAAKAINTPIITCELVAKDNVRAARIVKGRVEKTTVGDVAEYIEEVYEGTECYLELKIDVEALSKLQLETNVSEIANAIAYAPKLKIGAENVRTQLPDKVRVLVPAKSANELYYVLRNLKRSLTNVVIKGLHEVRRAVISEKEGGKGEKQLLVEGYGLRDVMTTEGIVGEKTTSNHIMDVQKVLGIEAARATIIYEIQRTMEMHGMTIDPRHTKLLADVMTSKGEVLGITRFGIAKMKDSVLMLASFEKTTDHLFDASLYSKCDAIEGVSEQIIMGIPMSIGTGLFKLIYTPEEEKKPAPRQLLFDHPEFHPRAAICIKAANMGADVAFCGLTPEGSEPVLKAIQEAGKRSFFQPFDISDLERTRAFVHQVAQVFGGIDGIVNNAGTNFFQGVLDSSYESIQHCFAVDFYPFWAICQEAHKYLKEAGGGIIVNLSSVHATKTAPGSFPYNAAKAAIVGLTRSVALEMGPDNIQCVALEPAMIETPLADRWFNTFSDPDYCRKRLRNHYPVNRFGTSEDVASTACYLLSHENRFLTVTTIAIDGGIGSVLESPQDP